MGELDWSRVIWATQVNHPTSRAGLARAQLAYARYLQDAARRSIDRQSRPGLWKGLRLIAAALLGFSNAGNLRSLDISRRSTGYFERVFSEMPDDAAVKGPAADRPARVAAQPLLAAATPSIFR